MWDKLYQYGIQEAYHSIPYYFCLYKACYLRIFFSLVAVFSPTKLQLLQMKGFLIFLNFIGVLELKEETIESLLAAACLLQLSQVIEVCCNFLMKQLHPSNCLGIRSFADAQGCMDLLNVAHNYTMVGLALWSNY